MPSGFSSHQDYPPASPVDIVSGPRRQRTVGFANLTINSQQKETDITTRSVRTNSTDSNSSAANTPRKARFLEATSVYSPAVGPNERISPFSDLNKMADQKQPTVSDVGFGYIADNQPVEQHATIRSDLNAGGAPLKSAMKTPGATRFVNPLSPTFREEQMLEKEEEATEKQQAKDLKVKTRVRMAKMLLRGVNFSCSLIVLSMLSTTLTVFNATKDLPARSGLPAWSVTTTQWPQLVVLAVSVVSLASSVIVMVLYCRGGRKRASKVAVYYTMFAIAYFIFSIVMWLIGAAILQGAKQNSNGNDIWGWSCKNNKRSQLFQDDVHYALVCRLQDWSLICCIIEVIVEIIVIAIYGVVFYRFYSKNRLRKSMDARDKARTDLYLAQLRSQSAPNTPGFAMGQPRTPKFPGSFSNNPESDAEMGEAGAHVQLTSPSSTTTSTPFKLQAPPTRHHTPKQPQVGFEPAPTSTTPPLPSQSPEPQERFNDHVSAAPGEQVYASVPIPGAYQPHAHQ